MKIIECVPNFSEGNDLEKINSIKKAITSFKDITLLDVDPGKATNRTVMTFAGPPDSVIKCAYEAIKTGGTAPCALNASNEVAVDLFLNKKIKFLDMIKIVEKSLENFIFVKNPKLEDYLLVDKETRKFSKELIKSL